MKRKFEEFRRCRSGATAIEYVMIAMLVALVIVSGATLIGKGVANDFTAVEPGFANATAS